jgi:hypothetical protein
MAIMMGDSMTGGAVAGSVLFVGAGPVLAQDNANLSQRFGRWMIAAHWVGEH